MATTSAKKWVEAAKILAENPRAIVRCPERDDGDLIIHDQASSEDPTMIKRYLVCGTCGARNVIRMRAKGKS